MACVQSLLLWKCLCTWMCLLQFLSAPTLVSTTPTPTPSPTTAAPSSPAPTPAPEASSSSNSRAATVAWAMCTVAVCGALLILLYNRETGKRRRIHPGESLRTNLTAADSLQPSYNPLRPPEERDPTMSSF